jgi:hypothetical protein
MVERASSAAGVDIRRDYALNSRRLCRHRSRDRACRVTDTLVTSLSWMRNRDHDIALLVPLLDVLEGLGYSLQGKTLIDDRPELAGRDKFGDRVHSRRTVHGDAAFQLLASNE